MSLFELGAVALREGEKRVEIASRNAVNTDTPGYKAQSAFAEASPVSSETNPSLLKPQTKSQRLDTQGQLFDSNSPLDFAIFGSGYFLVRNGSAFELSRGGQFGISATGAIIDPQGRILQLVTGGDATTSTFKLEVLTDGTMLDAGAPIGTLALYEPGGAVGTSLSGEQVAGLEASQSSEVRQSMLERSNVTLSDEMVEMMRAQRQVESGAQLLRAYDQLLTSAATTFGRNG